jgi:hypothetical protein
MPSQQFQDIVVHECQSNTMRHKWREGKGVFSAGRNCFSLFGCLSVTAWI